MGELRQRRLQGRGPFTYSLQARNSTLGFDLKAQIAKTTQQSLTWAFDLQAHSRKTNVMGGGISFQFDRALFTEMGKPSLLPGNRGWTWGDRAKGPYIEMRFDPPLTSVYIEPIDDAEVRAFFYKDQIVPGTQQIKGVLTVSQGIELAQTSDERFGLGDTSRWPLDQTDWRTSPVDLSFLNAGENRPASVASSRQWAIGCNSPMAPRRASGAPTSRPMPCSTPRTTKSVPRPSACRPWDSTSCACITTIRIG